MLVATTVACSCSNTTNKQIEHEKVRNVKFNRYIQDIKLVSSSKIYTGKEGPFSILDTVMSEKMSFIILP